MRRTLVYHLYIGSDIDENLCYKVHAECMKIYKHVFDNVKITISVDDLRDKNLIQKGIDWIMDIGFECELEIDITYNTNFREAKTFFNKVLKNEDDELIFFFHTKGVSNFVDTTKSIDSVFTWICGIYYYSLQSDYEAINILESTYRTMCGPFLLTPPEDGSGNFLQFYAGGGYWINNISLRNLRISGIVQELGLSDRFFSEKYPGMILSSYDDYGLEGVGRKMIIFGRVDGTGFYTGNKDVWDSIISIYDGEDNFWDFVNYIGNQVGYIPFS